MTDGVFFLKATPSNVPGAKSVGLDPVALGFACGGEDKYCSTAYSQMWGYYGPGAVAKLRAKYGITGRVAFVGFSAAHGFLNPLLNSDVDRAQIDTVLLLDASFGGGKAGYAKAVKDAATGRLNLVSATSNTGGDESWQAVLAQAGVKGGPASPVPPMPAPKGGVTRVGNLWTYRYDGAPPHWEFGKLQKPILQAHLWKTGGSSSGSGFGWGGVVLALLAGVGVAYYLRTRRNQDG